MARSRLRKRSLGRTWFCRHLCMPFVATKPLRILNLDGDGRPEGPTMADTPHQCDDVFFKPLAWSTSVSKATTGQLIFNVRGKNRHACWQTLDNHIEGTTMGFTGCEITKHACRLLATVRQFAFCSRSHDQRVGFNAEPPLLLSHCLMNKHPQTVDGGGPLCGSGFKP